MLWYRDVKHRCSLEALGNSSMNLGKLEDTVTRGMAWLWTIKWTQDSNCLYLVRERYLHADGTPHFTCVDSLRAPPSRKPTTKGCMGLRELACMCVSHALLRESKMPNSTCRKFIRIGNNGSFCLGTGFGDSDGLWEGWGNFTFKFHFFKKKNAILT